MYHFCIHFFIV